MYTSLDWDLTQDIIDKINEKLRECWDKSHIDDKTREYLLVSENARPGRFSLLPKLHKPGCPGRPVISGCNTPTERISQFVDNNLRSMVPKINSHFRDTNDFLRKLGELQWLPEGAIYCVQLTLWVCTLIFHTMKDWRP